MAISTDPKLNWIILQLKHKGVDYKVGRRPARIVLSNGDYFTPAPDERVQLVSAGETVSAQWSDPVDVEALVERVAA